MINELVVDKRYLNETHFVKEEMFNQTTPGKRLKNNKNQSECLIITIHLMVKLLIFIILGGYHVKLLRYQELIDNHLTKKIPYSQC